MGQTGMLGCPSSPHKKSALFTGFYKGAQPEKSRKDGPTGCPSIQYGEAHRMVNCTGTRETADQQPQVPVAHRLTALNLP